MADGPAWTRTSLPGLDELASHRDDPEYVAFAITLLGVCGCVYFGAKAWARLFSSDPPPESWTVVTGGLVVTGLLALAGLYLIAELESALVAAKALLSIGVLLVGIFVAFIAAMAVGMGGREVLGWGLGLAILVLTGVVLWLVLPA